MTDQMQTFVIWLCLLGNLAVIPLIAAFGLIGMLSKIIEWLEVRL